MRYTFFSLVWLYILSTYVAKFIIKLLHNILSLRIPFNLFILNISNATIVIISTFIIQIVYNGIIVLFDSPTDNLFCGIPAKDVLQGKLFQKCTHLLYCSVPSLGGNVSTRRMSKPDVGSIFHIKNQWNILVIRNYYMNYQNYQNLMLLTSSDTKRTLMHLFMFTNSAQRELVSMCTQSIHDRNKLSLHYTVWSL